MLFIINAKEYAVLVRNYFRIMNDVFVVNFLAYSNWNNFLWYFRAMIFHRD